MIGLLSDAHGHVAAFEKGLALLRAHGADRFLFLGDAVGYVPSWAVVDQLFDLRDDFEFILGNHEEALLNGVITSRDAVYQHALLVPGLTVERRAFLESWPRSATLSLPCGTVRLVHGSPADTQNGYLYPDTPLDDMDIEEDFLFCGHTHRPFIRAASQTQVINIGSCGLPRDDGRYGSVALFDEQAGTIAILRYDIQAECRALVTGPMPLHQSVRDLFDRTSDSPYGVIND